MSELKALPLIIWRLMDGKPGHESQTLGLIRALERLAAERGMVSPRCIDMPLGDYRYTFWNWLFKRFRPGFLKPRPDFIIGAGHRTHWPMLCARRSFGGKAIALMSPPWSAIGPVVLAVGDTRSAYSFARFICDLRIWSMSHPLARRLPTAHGGVAVRLLHTVSISRVRLRHGAPRPCEGFWRRPSWRLDASAACRRHLSIPLVFYYGIQPKSVGSRG